ncbi:complement component 1 Q subcomponent-binding protein, mitochondrial [Elysia marginata]|uniref:Complement component 1 Q subcomponent-binding protein, mitochondrial n=1 Tax=Elysia marginata TaxID=1093978 RepID=A0AAV4EXH6_9GAST|nr:complement component 1 Q subcomponent-binding protein, mitochondrial [Elysia marginata]
MAKALRFAFSTTSKYLISSGKSSSKVLAVQPQNSLNAYCSMLSASRVRSTSLSKLKSVQCASYSTEVDKEISKFLDKEIQFESSRSSQSLPSVPGFEVVADGGDLTFTKATGSEKVVVRLSVNGAVDSIMSENDHEKSDEPPQMVCKPPFEVELSKGDGKVLALQCSFPSQDQMFEDAQYQGQGQDAEQIDDQFEIQEVAIHDGEWKDTTFSVSAATMDAELFDLLMDMLDERGINDEFIGHLVDYCTAYENKQYVGFLNRLKSFADK